MTISVTPRATTAYSIVAETPPGVTDHKQLARLLLGHQLRHQAAIGTRDKQRFRILAGGQAAEELFTLRENLFLEVEEALNDMLHSSVSFLCFNDDMTKITFSQFITDARNGNRYSNRR